MSVSVTAARELAQQDCATAWLVLLEISHPALPAPLRLSSDAVATLSGGARYEPFPFEVVLPDDSEGRAPRAQIRIDNTSQEIVALLRGLTTPASLTIRIVRSADPNVAEREWAGLEWRTSAFDVSFITGTLSVDDLAAEEFPFVTFDGRFQALWP